MTSEIRLEVHSLRGRPFSEEDPWTSFVQLLSFYSNKAQTPLLYFCSLWATLVLVLKGWPKSLLHLSLLMILSSEARQGQSLEGDVYWCGCCPWRSFLRQTCPKGLHPFLSLRPRLCFCLWKLLDQMEGVSKFGLNWLCVWVCVCVWHGCLRSTMVSSSISAFLILGDRVFHELEGLSIEWDHQFSEIVLSPSPCNGVAGAGPVIPGFYLGAGNPKLRSYLHSKHFIDWFISWMVSDIVHLALGVMLL